MFWTELHFKIDFIITVVLIALLIITVIFFISCVIIEWFKNKMKEYIN